MEVVPSSVKNPHRKMSIIWRIQKRALIEKEIFSIPKLSKEIRKEREEDEGK